MVATGALDFYVVGKEYLRVIDIAASTLILRQAGGVVTNILGEPLDIHLNLDERTSVIADCNEEMVRKTNSVLIILEEVKKEPLNEEILQNVLKIQQLVEEVKND